jgi:small-conductance mechanosensitive channel
MEAIRSALTTIAFWLNWLPSQIVAILIIALAASIALVLHKWLRSLVRTLLEGRYPYLLSIFTEMRGLTRLAVLIFAMIIAVPVAPIPTETAELLARILLMAVVGLIGWAAVTALHILANVYLLRFRLDVDDNLLARKHNTQVRVLLRTVDVLIALITIGGALMTFPAVRQYGYSLFASAGVAGIVAGLAARPVLSNLFAGVQLAMTQPIRMDDVVIVEGEWGVIEEITSTYVVVRIWDLRRMILPLSYFIEKPFQNWTRDSSALIGTAFFYLDYRAPIGIIRDELNKIVQQSAFWNRKVVSLQVTDTRENVIEVRAIMSADDAGRAFNLRCEVREKMVDFLQREHPEALPHRRSINVIDAGGDRSTLAPLREGENVARKVAKPDVSAR